MKEHSKKSYHTLMAKAAKFILGESADLKLKGRPDKIQATKNVIIASKNLYEELNRENPSFEKIMQLVETKRVKSEIFGKVTGLRWAL